MHIFRYRIIPNDINLLRAELIYLGIDFDFNSVLKSFMNLVEVKGVCKDRSRLLSVITVYLHGKKAWFSICKII